MNRIILYLVLIVTLVALSFAGGCRHGKKQCNPETVTKIVIKYDTVTKTIIDKVPYYIIKHDSISYPVEVPANVDTALILEDYFATHIVNRIWQDSLLKVDLTDYISQNKPVHNVFNYQILRPQQIIINVDNSKHYSRYITAGLSVPIKDIRYTSFETNFIFRSGYIGAFYNYGLQSFGISAGTTLFRFK